VPNHFYTPLSQPLFLEDPSQWKVSLRELTYQNTIQTIIDEGVEVWNDALGELEEMERIDYDAHNSKYLLNLVSAEDDSHEYHLDENAIANAGYLLHEGVVVRVERNGAKVKEYIFKDALTSFTFEVTEHRNEKLIMEHLMVGDSQAPLLRTTHLHNSEHGAVDNEVFNPALYVRICKPHIGVIEVDIRTDSGAPFPLSAEGKLILTLHFKRDYSSLSSAFYQPHPSSHQRQLLPPPPAPSLLPAMVHSNTVFLHGTTAP